MLHAYEHIYKRCGLKAVIVEADSGAIGGKFSHEFMLPTESGEDTVIPVPNAVTPPMPKKPFSIKARPKTIRLYPSRQ